MLSSLYGGSGSGSSSSSSSLLSIVAQGMTSNTATATTTAAAAAKKTIPTAPWDSTAKAPKASDLVRSVMAGHKFVDLTAAQLDVAGASQDYRKLFALYQGLNALQGLTEQAADTSIGPTRLAELQKTFAAGMTEVSGFLDTLKLDQLRLTRGEAMTKDVATVGAPKDAYTYTTGVVHTGTAGSEVAAFQGDVQFNAQIKRGTNTYDVAFDLSEMGSTPRTMSNVVSYLNGKLKDAGMATKFTVEHLPNDPRTVTVGSKTVTLPAGPDQWALKIKGDSIETLTLSAPATAGAVYVTQTTGVPAPAASAVKTAKPTPPPAPQQQQLLKFQTDLSETIDAPPSALTPAGLPFAADGEVFAKSLGDNVSAVHASASGPDGSVYVLADVDGAVGGQTIKGAQDVALIKYDSAGNVVFSRTLGAADQASGMALTVAADGKVAIAGSVTGVLNKADAGLNPKLSDSFVTVFDGQGQELWTQRRTAVTEDQATAVSFGPDGSVYIAGRARTVSAVGDGPWQGYVEGYSWNGKSGETSKVANVLKQSLGGAADMKVTAMTSDGTRMFVATGGSKTTDPAMVYGWTFDPAGGATSDGSQSVGVPGGGQITALAIDGGDVVAAGYTSNGTPDSDPGVQPGAVNGYAGGTSDAFVARLSSSLQPSASDTFAFVGGGGAEKATALKVVDGQVWIAGTSTGDLGDQAAIGKQDGFLARVDTATGALQSVNRFTAQDSTATPSSISVDSTGSSVLDRLGLPKGTLAYSLPAATRIDADETLVTSATSVRAGDKFYVKTGEGGQSVAVTIAGDDTFKSLTTKINRAMGFQGTATFVIDGDVKELQIKALNGRTSIEISAGKDGRNTLEALGLKEGVVQNAVAASTTGSAKPPKKTYGLTLNLSMDLGSSAKIKTASDELRAAMSTIRSAYKDLLTASQPKTTTNPTANGPVPAYLTSQIANYQAALSRLTGGG